MKSLGLLAALLALGATSAPAQTPACCSITTIEAATGLVSAKVAANNQVFQFKVADARALSSLRVGQGVFANFTTRQVSLDGRSACCAITSGPTAPTVAPGRQPPPVAPAPAPAPTPLSSRPLVIQPATGPASSEAYCPQTRAITAQRLQSLGRISCSRDPARPVILLVHGLHQSAKTWTEPSDVGYSYDYSRHPGENRIGDTHDKPNAGIYKLGYSPWLYGSDQAGWDRQVNWFDFLAEQGFTVATWSQPGTSLADAWDSAVQMAEQVFNLTRDRNPGAPPPVALIGHSRGGLLIRKLLKEKRTMPGMERVKWVVTLHSPHQGTELGRYPGRMAAEMVDLLDCCVPPVVSAAFKPQLKDLVTEAMRPLSKSLVDFESRELVPDGPLLRDLSNGETPMPGVKYYTFGGTNPTFFRLYAWVFDAMSAVPQLRDLTTYYVWRVKPVELSPLSPALDGIRDFAPEVTVGAGDGLVSNQAARLPWSTHFTTKLNHAEVLWDRPLQLQVLQLIEPGGRGPASGRP